MKFHLSIFLLFLMLHNLSCRKANQLAYNYPGTDTIPGDLMMYNTSCENRPMVYAKLIQVGKLSEGRLDMTASAAGSKILFAGGYAESQVHLGWDSSTRVDILDTTSNTWSTAELNRVGGQEWVSEGVAENKVYFAGGNTPGNSNSPSESIDIYDAVTNTWSTDSLSEAREGIAVASVGSKVLFAGGVRVSGVSSSLSWESSAVVDIYDIPTNTWSTAQLSQPRYKISSTTAANKIYFAGGNIEQTQFSNSSQAIDIYDESTKAWGRSAMRQPKSYMASIAIEDRIFWAGGDEHTTSYPFPMTAEVRNLSTGASSLACMISRTSLKAVLQNELIIFFTGYGPEPAATHFEIFNTKTNNWTTAVLPFPLFGAAIISINNTVYVAGGTSTGFPPYHDEVWKLELVH